MQYLIITRDNGDIEWGNHGELLQREAAHVWGLYKSGCIRNIWFTKGKDAVLLAERENENAARAMIDELPLVKEGLLLYSLEELLPYTGIERLFHGTN